MCFKKKTLQGVKINRNKVPNLPSDDDHTKAIDLLITECSKYFDKKKVEETIKIITIEWWDYIAPSPSTGNLNTVVVYNDKVYSGLTVNTTCKIAWRGKFFRSAFAHEFLHVIGQFVLNDSNADHKNKQLLEIELIINKKLSELNL